MQDNPWVSGKEASQLLGVSEKTLEILRDRGYLKCGTHWRTSGEVSPIPWTQVTIYHLRWCREEIDHWLSRDAPINDIAA